jgi:uncharacterized protein YdiU (UPF0061 family)
MQIQFDNSYARLPERFFERVSPAHPPSPKVVKLNRALANDLSLDTDWLSSPEGVDFLSGRQVVMGSEPIALAYAGHQFGNFVPQLGDGRAILLGEILDSSGRRRDLQLKGAGRTRFSRGGDGRAALGPVLREYLVSESMAALGVPTTRALSAVTTGETIYREKALPGASLVRVALSHVRVGTFQYYAAREDDEGLANLADYVIARHYPEAAGDDQPYRAMLDAVIGAQAELVAKWLLVGFIHGVMNTDNCSVSGETIDYGPCAFMDAYDPATVFSSIDRHGRYAYGNQPRMAHWNLTRLAEAMLPLLGSDQESAIEQAHDALAAFGPKFEQAYHEGLGRKLGLSSLREGDVDIASTLLAIMTEHQVDFTLLFRRLGDAAVGDPEPARSTFLNPADFDAWAARWLGRLGDETAERSVIRDRMNAINPAFIPRNHHVEAMIKAAVDDQDFEPFEQLLSVLSRPYEDQEELARFAQPPQPHERVLATFCGT